MKDFENDLIYYANPEQVKYTIQIRLTMLL